MVPVQASAAVTLSGIETLAHKGQEEAASCLSTFGRRCMAAAETGKSLATVYAPHLSQAH